MKIFMKIDKVTNFANVAGDVTLHHCTIHPIATFFTITNLTAPETSRFKMKMNLSILLGIVGNIVSVVGVVITNKYIVEVDNYDYMIFLSFLHFMFTTIGTRVLLFLGLFEYKEAPLSGVLPVSIVSEHFLRCFLFSEFSP